MSMCMSVLLLSSWCCDMYMSVCGPQTMFFLFSIARVVLFVFISVCGRLKVLLRICLKSFHLSIMSWDRYMRFESEIDVILYIYSICLKLSQEKYIVSRQAHEIWVDLQIHFFGQLFSFRKNGFWMKKHLVKHMFLNKKAEQIFVFM